MENGTLRATPERLEAIMDAILALDEGQASTVQAAADARARRFRDPDANGKKYAVRGTGYKSKAKRKKAADLKLIEAEALTIVKSPIRAETKVKILLGIFGIEKLAA